LLRLLVVQKMPEPQLMKRQILLQPSRVSGEMLFSLFSSSYAGLGW